MLLSYIPVKAICDPSGEKIGLVQEVHAAREHVRLAAGTRHAPELTAILEDDLRLRHSRVVQQYPVHLRRSCGGDAREDERRCQPSQHDSPLHSPGGALGGVAYAEAQPSGTLFSLTIVSTS